MLNDAIIVQSAISAFNNAALAAPAFLWWAVLSMPIFIVAAMFGDAIKSRFGWMNGNIEKSASVLTVVMTLVWLVLFGGNYGVLRDNVSLLPFMVAAILFVGGMFVGSNIRKINLPQYRGASRGRKLLYIICILVVLGMFIRSDLHAWWGPILQLGAIGGGLVLGRRASGEMRAVPGAALIMMSATTAILMQPEFFRFGQLGGLTPIHLMFVMLVGAFVAAMAAVRNINPSGRIHRSAYIKLKWMARFVCALGVVLFVLTESVPVFLGTSAALFVSFALSVWHADKVSPDLPNAMFAICMMLFGIITVMPAITAMGIVCLGKIDVRRLWFDARFLL